MILLIYFIDIIIGQYHLTYHSLTQVELRTSRFIDRCHKNRLSFLLSFLIDRSINGFRLISKVRIFLREIRFLSKEEMADLFAMADLVISRAGANAICEIASLRKPNLLIPLSAKASRGDQILNARSFENQGFSVVIEEESLTTMTLLQAVDDLYEKRQTYIDAMSKSDQSDAVSVIVKLIEENRRGA